MIIKTTAEEKYIPIYYPESPSYFMRKGGYAGLSVQSNFAALAGIAGPPAPAVELDSVDRVFDSAPMPVSTTIPGLRRSGPSQKPIEIRKTFPETWIYDSFDFDAR